MFYIGADPEVFVLDECNNIISGDTIFPKRGINTDYGNIGSDGLALEIRPNPVEITPNNVEDAIDTLFGNIMGMENEFIRSFDGYSIVKSPIIDVTEEILMEAGEDANRFGCEPDIDVYSGAFCKERDASSIMVRTAGGHIHFGFHENNEIFKNVESFIENQATIIKLFDALIALPLCKFETELGFQRRALYGQPGAYRIQQWGIEYRTLGNDIFYTNYKDIYSKAFNILSKITDNPDSGKEMLGMVAKRIDEDDIVSAILGQKTIKESIIDELVEEIGV